jgi:branched-chain amino acid aminotransferase
MLEVDYTTEKGWSKPLISPYHCLQIDPRNSTLHYAIELFEGMKAFKNNDKLMLFRPDKNMARMNISAKKVCLPVYYY